LKTQNMVSTMRLIKMALEGSIYRKKSTASVRDSKSSLSWAVFSIIGTTSSS